MSQECSHGPRCRSVAHTESHNYSLRSGWILGVDLTCIKVYLTLEKKGFLLLIRLLFFFFLIPGRVFIFIMLNADFLVSIPSLVHTLKCQRIMFFALSENIISPQSSTSTLLFWRVLLFQFCLENYLMFYVENSVSAFWLRNNYGFFSCLSNSYEISSSLIWYF